MHGRKKKLMRNSWPLFSRLIQFVWILSIAFVAYFSLSPQVDFSLEFRGIDKLYHSLAYLWLAAAPFFGFPSIKIALVGALLMIPFGIGLEYAQDYVHGRFFSVVDMIANGTGVILGMVLGRYLKYRFFAGYQS